MASLLILLRRLLPYLRPYRRAAMASAAAALVATAAGLLTPWPIKIVVDSVIGSEPLPRMAAWLAPNGFTKPGLLVTAVVGGLVVTLVTSGLGVLTSYLNTRLELAMALDFRSALFQQAQRLSLAYHDQRRAGMVIYIINGMGGSAPALVMAAPPLAQNALSLLGMFVISFRINPRLALLSLSVVPLLYYSVGYYSTHIRRRLLAVKSLEGETLSIIHEAISMLRVIVAFAREDYEHDRFRGQGLRANDARVRVTVRQTLFSLAVNTTTAAGTALVLGYGAWLVLGGKLTIGQLLVVLAYIGSVYRPLEAISSTIGALQDQVVNLEMAFGLLDREPDIADAPGAKPLVVSSGHVQFDRVSFHYEGRDATLADISFDAAPGEAIAIVGPTGAGKSTLVSLLPRFYDPAEGRVLIDGQDIRGATIASLRGQISIVLQEPLLFSSSIADNIRYGRLSATLDEVMEAARAANAHDFITALPEQYETSIGERGAKLSGGERQRIAIARAFLKNAPILILDEPTSSVDAKTEAGILDALDRLMVGRTTFVVAHRLSTIRRASRIVVLNHGRIVETGTHDELLRLNGLYRQLHDVQSGVVKRELQKALAAGRPAAV